MDEIKQLKIRKEDFDKQKSQLIADLKNAARLLYLDILEPVIEREFDISQKRREGIMSIHLNAVRNDVTKEILRTVEETGICICGRRADQNHIDALKDFLKHRDLNIEIARIRRTD